MLTKEGIIIMIASVVIETGSKEDTQLSLFESKHNESIFNLDSQTNYDYQN